MLHSFILMYVTYSWKCLFIGVASLQEVVKEPLKTFSAALDILLPRLQPNADVKGVSIEDQESFVSLSPAVLPHVRTCMLQHHSLNRARAMGTVIV